jgi:ubiquitin-conjugating enzyme E2 J2
MATDICTRRLTKELRALQKDPISSPKILVQPNEANILEMHYVIEGSEKTPYDGGIYWGKLIFPKTYPLKPPSVMMITPSGRFQPNRRLCLSMSDFHPETWNPMWSVCTILTGLYSFMLETAPTLGSIETTSSQKQKHARQSLEFNVRDSTFCKLFPEYLEIHRKRLEERQAALGISGTEPLLSGLSSLDHNTTAHADGGDFQGIFTTAAGIIAILSAVVFAIRFI